MFRPTQTAPTILTAFNIVVGFLMALTLLVLALLNTAETGVIAELHVLGDAHSGDTGLIFLAAVFTFIAAIRPLAGGIALGIMGVIIISHVPAVGVAALVFSALSLARAYLSRQYLSAERRG